VTRYFRYRSLMARQEPPRYRNLIKAIYHERSRRIVEVGVHDGIHAVQMIETAALHHPVSTVEYFGFDLFEEPTQMLLRAEFSRRPPAVQYVLDRLKRTGASVRLFQGDTRTTLRPAFAEIGVPDFVFIDGGHSGLSITSDWNAVRGAIGPNTTVIFDDYYAEAGPELEGVGCQNLIDGLDPAEYQIEHLSPIDSFHESWGTRLVAMVRVRRRQ
jgi:hypothetical protein